MNNSHIRHLGAAEGAALEGRFGLRVAAKLHAGSAELPHDIQERLRIARQNAVARARHQTRLAQAPAQQHVGGGLLAMGGPESSWWVRLGSLAPLLLLVAGLLFLQEWQNIEQIDAAAQIDAELLLDDLPPEAYSDPAFTEYLLTPAAAAQE